MARRLITVTAFFAGITWQLSPAALCIAQDDQSQSPPGAQQQQSASPAPESARPRQPLEVTPEREAAAMTFVKQHHPELAELLIYLKENRTREYQRAVRDLFRTSERLAAVRERDPRRHELELDLWKIQSRVQLLTARLKMQDRPQLRQQLRQALDERVDRRLALLEYEREKLSDRMQRLDDQIQRIEQTRGQIIRTQLRQLVGPRDNASGTGNQNVPTKVKP